jgi:hypothetical protein
LLLVDNHILIYTTYISYGCSKPLNLMSRICNQFINGGVCLSGFFRDKSWTVRLVNGYVLDNRVRSEHCRDCDSIAKLVVSNNSNPDLLLYGCNGHKCKHNLIRIKFPEADQTPITFPPLTVKSSEANLQEITRTV